MSAMTTKPYPLSNLHRTSLAHHDALSDLLDDDTMYRITRLPVDTWTGASALEVGAGAGSVALKLRHLVGDTGRVVALDLHPQLEPAPGLEVVQHDLLTDDPLPAGPYQLIHARLTLGHLPPRRQIAARLADLLAPGGWICLEDFRARREGIVVRAADDEDASIIAEFQRTVGEKVFDAAGTDPSWAPSIHGVLTDLGLTSVDTRVFSSYWTAANAGSRFLSAIHAQTFDKVLAAGMALDRLERVPEIMLDPRTVVRGHDVYSVVAQRA